MIDQLQEQIKVVIEVRCQYHIAKDNKDSALKMWEEQNEDIISSASIASENMTEAEAKLRELTLQAYAETGDKAPAPGVGIRERTVLTYDGKVAFDWAKSHKMALQLDKKAFEKIAKVSDLDFVDVATEPIATIATTLEVSE